MTSGLELSHFTAALIFAVVKGAEAAQQAAHRGLYC